MNKKNHLWKVGIALVNEQTTQRKRNASLGVFGNGKCDNWLAKIGDNPDYLLASCAMSLFVY